MYCCNIPVQNTHISLHKHNNVTPFTFGGTEETNFTNHLTVAPGPSSSAVCDEILDDNIVSDEGVHLSSGSKMYSVGLALAVKVKLVQLFPFFQSNVVR